MPPTRVLLFAMPDTIIGFNLAARLPNLGLVSIAANRDPNECDIRVLDLVLCRHAVLRCIKKALDKFKPEIVGLSCMIFQYNTARNIARWIKEQYNPEITIVFGGYYPTVCYDEFGENYNSLEENGKPSYKSLNPVENMNACPWCDFIVRGEGEITFKEFIHAWRNHLSYDSILGLSWRDKQGKFHHNPQRPNLDLSQLKLPDRSIRMIQHGYHCAGKPGDVVETSRGCTNLCKFCSIACMYGRTLRLYSLERVMEDIIACKKRGVKSILFIDDNITLKPERLEELCDRIIKAKLKMEFHVQASVHGLLSRPNLIEKMGKAGFSIVFFGIENINPETLKFFKKSIPLNKLKYLVHKLHKNGMLTFGGFIVGLPDDTKESFERNLQFAKQLNLDVPAWQTITPFPRTENRAELIKAGLVTNLHEYSRYTGIASNIRTKYMTTEEVDKELLRCYVKYYTPMWFLKRLLQFRLWRFLPYALHVGWKNKHYVIPAWNKLWMGRRKFKEQKTVEDSVISEFNQINKNRDILTRI